VTLQSRNGNLLGLQQQLQNLSSQSGRGAHFLVFGACFQSPSEMLKDLRIMVHCVVGDTSHNQLPFAVVSRVPMWSWPLIRAWADAPARLGAAGASRRVDRELGDLSADLAIGVLCRMNVHVEQALREVLPTRAG